MLINAEHLQHLLLKSAWGDHEAFTALYHGTAPALLALASRILADREQAEEVLQEAFVQAWYQARDYDPTKGTAMAWLAGITRHRALDRRRHEQRHQARRQALAQQPAPLPAPEPTAHVQYRSEVQALLDCLQPLGEQQRQSLLLVYYDGYSHSEVAQRLQQPLGTVKGWIRRGLVSLRACLGVS
jgi:RNA polymerase sigma-70 factor (ECF subfamily)